MYRLPGAGGYDAPATKPVAKVHHEAKIILVSTPVCMLLSYCLDAPMSLTATIFQIGAFAWCVLR